MSTYDPRYRYTSASFLETCITDDMLQAVRDLYHLVRQTATIKDLANLQCRETSDSGRGY